MTAPPAIILASASPRRAELLTRLGLVFRVEASGVPEDPLDGETPAAHAERLSREKAQAIWGRNRDALVIGGDTVVVLDGRILGKPSDAEEAVSMLKDLSGRTHTVVSGLAVVLPRGDLLSGITSTEVTFRTVDEAFARAYVATGEPMDKAGAYGIQGLGSALVREIRGDYHTVVGLPIPLLLDLLSAGGYRYAFGALVPPSRGRIP